MNLRMSADVREQLEDDQRRDRRFAATAEGGVIQHAQHQPEQGDGGADQPSAWQVDQTEHGLERECGQDSQSRVAALATLTTPESASCSPPARTG